MTSYTLPAEEINDALLKKLRKIFSGKKVMVTVTEVPDLEKTAYPINPKVKSLMGILQPDTDVDVLRTEYITKKHLH